MDGTDGTDGMYPRSLLRLEHLAVLKILPKLGIWLKKTMWEKHLLMGCPCPRHHPFLRWYLAWRNHHSRRPSYPPPTHHKKSYHIIRNYETSQDLLVIHNNSGQHPVFVKSLNPLKPPLLVNLQAGCVSGTKCSKPEWEAHLAGLACCDRWRDHLHPVRPGKESLGPGS